MKRKIEWKAYRKVEATLHKFSLCVVNVPCFCFVSRIFISFLWRVVARKPTQVKSYAVYCYCGCPIIKRSPSLGADFKNRTMEKSLFNKFISIPLMVNKCVPTWIIYRYLCHPKNNIRIYVYMAECSGAANEWSFIHFLCEKVIANGRNIFVCVLYVQSTHTFRRQSVENASV